MYLGRIGIAALVLGISGGIGSSARAQTAFQENCSTSTTNSCSITFDSSHLTINNLSSTTKTFTLTGPDSGSGSFSFALPSPTTISVTGTQTINGITADLDCTIDLTSLATSGQCGVIAAGLLDTGGGAASTQAATTAVAAAQGQVRSQSQTVVTIVSDRVRAISRDIARSFAPGPAGEAPLSSYRGIAAGSADSPWGVWGDASGAFLRNDTRVGYDGTSVVALTGVDYLYDKTWLGGFSVGYLHGDLDLKSTGGPRVSDGAVFGPYVSYIIGPYASLDGQFQYARLSNRVSAPLAGINASFGSNRLTGAVNLNIFADEGPWKLTGFTGYAYTWEGAEDSVLNRTPPYSAHTRYGVWKAGTEIGYLATPQLEAYVPLTLRVETTTPRDLTSRVSLEVGAGLRYQVADNIKAGLMATTTEIKTHTRDIRVGGNLRWTF